MRLHIAGNAAVRQGVAAAIMSACRAVERMCGVYLWIGVSVAWRDLYMYSLPALSPSPAHTHTLPTIAAQHCPRARGGPGLTMTYACGPKHGPQTQARPATSQLPAPAARPGTHGLPGLAVRRRKPRRSGHGVSGVSTIQIKPRFCVLETHGSHSFVTMGWTTGLVV